MDPVDSLCWLRLAKQSGSSSVLPELSASVSSLGGWLRAVDAQALGTHARKQGAHSARGLFFLASACSYFSLLLFLMTASVRVRLELGSPESSSSPTRYKGSQWWRDPSTLSTVTEDSLTSGIIFWLATKLLAIYSKTRGSKESHNLRFVPPLHIMMFFTNAASPSSSIPSWRWKCCPEGRTVW